MKLPAAAQLWNKSPISEGAVWEQTDDLGGGKKNKTTTTTPQKKEEIKKETLNAE